MKSDGLIHVYTGEGKGKTTTALGMACRARGQNLKVGYISFHKDHLKWKTGEYNAMKWLGIDIYEFAKEHPLMTKSYGVCDLKKECKDAMSKIEEMYSKNYDMLILDELNVALRDGFAEEKDVLELIDKKPKSLELVITGREAPKSVIDKADLVSEIFAVKHPFENGIYARKGIEF